MDSKELKLTSGSLPLPIFLPVATRGFVKAVPMQVINGMKIDAMISNSVHLSISPGIEKLEKVGGINGYTGFKGSYFTDSGGFQVLRKDLVKIGPNGIDFRDAKSGRKLRITPEISSSIQEKIRSHVAMMLDDCPPYGATAERYRQSVNRTYEWGKTFSRFKVNGQLRFGIVQGGFDIDLRKESADLMTSLDFDGFAIGGLKIGEPRELTDKVLEKTVKLVPKDFPIYLMGVGDPISIFHYSGIGVDIFDSTYPTRNARHGFALTERGQVNLKNARYSDDFGPIEDGCSCETCVNYSKYQIRELLKNEDPSFQYLVTVHNLDFMIRLISHIRDDRVKAKDIILNFSKFNNGENHKEQRG